jgi:sporulation protein YlmC with PRC-barrel domain
MEDASKIKGADVYGADNKKIGTVSTVLMKPDSKTVDRLVVVSGSVLNNFMTWL